MGCLLARVLALGVTVHPPICFSVCHKLARRRITQTVPHDSQRTPVFWYQKSQQNSNGVTHNRGRGAECNWGRLHAGAVAENWRVSTCSIVNLGRSQVYHSENPHYLFAGRLPWCTASHGFVSDS